MRAPIRICRAVCLLHTVHSTHRRPTHSSVPLQHPEIRSCIENGAIIPSIFHHSHLAQMYPLISKLAVVLMAIILVMLMWMLNAVVQELPTPACVWDQPKQRWLPRPALTPINGLIPPV